jgi:hypothetical protein
MWKAVTTARKQNAHKTIGPAAPRNLRPNVSNSIGPLVTLRIETMQKAVTADIGVPTRAA